MAKIIDITGTVQEGMWNYEQPFPEFRIRPLPKVPWVKGNVYCEVFEGMHSQTGTYLETSAHFYGNDGSYLLIDVPVEKLVNIPCVVINIELESPPNSSGRAPITVADLEKCKSSQYIKEGDALLIGCNWGRYWMDQNYLTNSPYFTYDAMMWIIGRKPVILGSDVPRWENLERYEGFFSKFYEADILMLAPCVNLEQIVMPRSKLTVLPLKIPRTSCVPCRAVVIEE